MLLTIKPGKKAFDYANRIGAHRIAYVAPDEWAAGNVRVKDLRSEDKGEDGLGIDVPVDELVTTFKVGGAAAGGADASQ